MIVGDHLECVFWNLIFHLGAETCRGLTMTWWGLLSMSWTIIFSKHFNTNELNILSATAYEIVCMCITTMLHKYMLWFPKLMATIMEHVIYVIWTRSKVIDVISLVCEWWMIVAFITCKSYVVGKRYIAWVPVVLCLMCNEPIFIIKQ